MTFLCQHHMFESNFMKKIRLLCAVMIKCMQNLYQYYGSQLKHRTDHFNWMWILSEKVSEMDLQHPLHQWFSTIIQMRWKFGFSEIPLLDNISPQNCKHATIAKPLCHVPNFIAITSIQLGREQNGISIKFGLWWKNHLWNGLQVSCHEKP